MCRPLGKVLKDAHRIDLLDEGLYQRLLANPSLFSGMVQALDENRWVVLDEVQRFPDLLNDVHYRELDSMGRSCHVSIIRRFAVYYWPDHAEKEIRIVDLIETSN